MKIIMTGASGRTTRMIIQGLLDRGVSASALVLVSRTPELPVLAPFASQGADLRYGDFTDLASLPAAFVGGDLIYVMPMNHPPPQVDEAAAKIAVIATAAQAGVKHAVYQSTFDADVNPGHADELETEAALKASGLGWTVLRMAWLAESLGRECKGYLRDGRLVFYPWAYRHGFVSRSDIAAAAAAVLTGERTGGVIRAHHGKTYNLIGPTVSRGEVAALLSRLGGRTIDAGAVDRGEQTDAPPSSLPRLIGRPGKSLLDLLSENSEELLTGKPPLGREVMFGFQWQARGQAERPMDLGLRMHLLHEAIKRGDRGVLVRFGILLGKNPKRVAGWRATHPEWFWWEKHED